VQSETARIPAAAASPGRQREVRSKLQIAVKTATHANSAASAHQGAIGGPCRGKTSGGTTARAVVVNVTVAIAGFDPSSVT
jgi:hypothetical protein